MVSADKNNNSFTINGNLKNYNNDQGERILTTTMDCLQQSSLNDTNT